MQWLYLELLIYIHPFWVFLSTVNFVAWPPWLSPDSRCSHFLVKAYWLWTSSVNSQVDGMKIWFPTIFSFSVCSGVPSDCFRVGNCLLETSCGIHWGGRNAVAFPAVSLMLFFICIKQYLNYKYQMRHLNDACWSSINGLFLWHY